MAVDILLGAPGSGKSYEAVAFHVLPALALGRKVITNLPLNLDELALLDPAYPSLVELRKVTLAVRPEFDAKKAEGLFRRFGIAAKVEYFNSAAFSHVEDYSDSWRHSVSGTGPLYVIDECHLALPSRGTPRAVEDWFSLHRHESADVLLISQSHSKISRSVVELIQTCYRVRKNTALGSSNSYRRAVLDGVRGEKANFSIRKYQPQYFKLYSSYTRGGGQEQAASDIVPIWKRPIIVSAFISILVAGFFVARTSNPLALGKTAPVEKSPLSSVSASSLQSDPIPRPATSSSSSSSSKPSPDHALSAYQLHQVGDRFSGGVLKIFYTLSKNGLVIFSVDSHQLISMGYEVTQLEKCFSHVRHVSGWSVYASCDSPSQGMGLPGRGSPSGAAGEGPATAGGPPAASGVEPRPFIAPSLVKS